MEVDMTEQVPDPPRKTRIDSDPIIKDGDATFPDIPGYCIVDRQEAEKRGWTAQIGGQGVVYLVDNTTTQLEAVVKLYPKGTDSLITHTLKILRNIDHNQIVKPRHFGCLGDGRLYVIMDRIRGETLDAYLECLLNARESSDVDLLSRVTRLVWRIAMLVSLAHKGVAVHADLKPANIIVARDQAGESFDIPYLLDFDIAWSSASFNTNQPQGTPSWMAPEQFAGQKPQTATDVYALGRILYFVVTGGRFPYKSSPYEELIHPAIRVKDATTYPGELATRPGNLPLRPPSESIPESIWNVIQKALRLKIEDRYESAGEFATHLLSALNSHPARSTKGPNLCNRLGSILQRYQPSAVELKELEVWKRRLQNTELIDCKEECYSQRTLLFWAIETGEVHPNMPQGKKERTRRKCCDLVKCIIDECAPLIRAQDDYGWTPLHLASNLGLVNVVEVLLQSHANPDQQANHIVGESVRGGGATPLYEAAFCPHQAEAKAIIDRLEAASTMRDGGLGKKLVNQPTIDGFTPLMASIWRRNINTAKYLFEKKADEKHINGQGFDSYFLAVNAFCQAAQSQDTTMVEFICARFANLKLEWSHDPHKGQAAVINTALMNGDMSQAISDINTALRMHKKDELHMQLPPFQRTLLHQAAERGYYDIVMHLCKKAGLDPLVRNNNGRTPRDVAPIGAHSVRKYLENLEHELRFRG
jgi:serine/threonine protein kinase/ankyrin repeat protein